VTVAGVVADVLGHDPRVAFRGYDGSRCGPADAPATLVVHSPDVLRRLVWMPNQLGLARAYVAGDVDIEGDIFAVLGMRDRLAGARIRATDVVAAARTFGVRPLLRRPPVPDVEARLRGRRHSKARDAEAIAYHYDVSNDFYGIVLGPSMTYSCAVWSDTTATLEDAQRAKHELICRKLGLRPGMRLLDVGCGWGGMLLHAAAEHGVRAVGVTLSRPQAELAAKRVADAGLDGRVDVRLCDYRDVDDGPYDAISSIGMFEHVGRAELARYFIALHSLLAPGGRLLNHGISRSFPAERRLAARAPRSTGGGSRFIDRYVFPDGELHEIGMVVSTVQRAGFEARHVESLREHYPLTLRRWVANLEAGWDEAVREAGATRARIWRLYMAVSAIQFEAGAIEIHQVLATRTTAGRSGLPLRPDF
jgi:cyclopropane-fatty-acyl-phospholipid synthase